MTALPTVLSDLDRLTAIARLDLDHPELRARLDAVTADTARTLGSSIGLVSVMLDSAAWVLATAGPTPLVDVVGGAPAEWTFCLTVVVTGADVVIPDAAVDPRWVDHPSHVIAGIRSYAGTPVIASNGQIIGALCVSDHQPRHYTPAELTRLTEAGHQVAAILQEYPARA